MAKYRTLNASELADELDTLRELEETDETNEEFDAARLEVLETLEEDLDGDIEGHGPLIVKDDFAEYAKEYAANSANVNDIASWPLNHVDWDRAAEDLKVSFVEIEFEGCTYLYEED